MLVGLAEISAAGALDIRKTDGVYEIVEEGKVLGTFWNPKTDGSDVKFTADKGAPPQFFWSEGHQYLAANGGTAKNRQVYLYEIGDGSNWTPVVPGQLSDGQLAPLNAIGDDWAASGTEAVRWEQDNTLLMRVWAVAPAKGDDKPKTASIWASLKMDGAKSKVVGVSTEEPMAPEVAAKAPPGDAEKTAADTSTRRLDPERLAGEHKCVGRNPDGSEYEGTVVIRVKGGLLLFQWTIGDSVTHGTGLLEDMTVGVGLESGLAIYQAFPQADGISLIGLWKTEGAKKTNEETILIGNADMMSAKIEVRPMNGEYDFRRELPDDAPMEGSVKISGGDVAKKFEFQFADGNFDGEGLALGDGLAVITPDGLAVYAIAVDGGGKEHFAGEFVNAKSELMRETLKSTE
jgi:hypothetical protein